MCCRPRWSPLSARCRGIAPAPAWRPRHRSLPPCRCLKSLFLGRIRGRRTTGTLSPPKQRPTAGSIVSCRPSFRLKVKKELPAFPIRMEQDAVSDAVVPMCGKTFSCPCFFLPMRWRLLAQAVWRMNGPREERFIRCTGPLENRRRTERAPRGLKCENTAGYAPLSTSESTDGNALLRNVTS